MFSIFLKNYWSDLAQSWFIPTLACWKHLKCFILFQLAYQCEGRVCKVPTSLIGSMLNTTSGIKIKFELISSTPLNIICRFEYPEHDSSLGWSLEGEVRVGAHRSKFFNV